MHVLSYLSVNIKGEKVFLLEYKAAASVSTSKPKPGSRLCLRTKLRLSSSLGTFSTISYHTGQPTHSPFCRWYRGCPYDDELLSVDALMLTSCKLQHSALIIRAVCENVARAWVENVKKGGFCGAAWWHTDLLAELIKRCKRYNWHLCIQTKLPLRISSQWRTLNWKAATSYKRC